MTGRFATVLVVALVVLAGCSGGPATSTTPDAGTTEAQPTTATTDGGDGPNRVTVPSNVRPPGASARGISNPRTLLRAHADALANVSSESTLTYTSLDPNATGSVEYAVARTAEGSYVASERTVGNGTPVGEDVYFTGDAVTIRSVQPTDTSYQYAKGPTRTTFQYQQPSSALPSVSLFYFTLSSGTRATDFATINGQKTTRYDATGVNDTRFQQYRGALGVPNGTVEDFSFTAYVSPSGVIQDAEATLVVGNGSGGTETFTMDHSVESYGSADVSQPPWVTSVPQLNGTVVRNGTAVRVENVGDSTLDEHTVGVQGNVTASVGVNESIASGETRYLYVTGSENDTTLSVTDDASSVPADARYLLEQTSVSVFVGSENVSISLRLFDRSQSENESAGATEAVVAPTALASLPHAAVAVPSVDATDSSATAPLDVQVRA